MTVAKLSSNGPITVAVDTHQPAEVAAAIWRPGATHGDVRRARGSVVRARVAVEAQENLIAVP